MVAPDCMVPTAESGAGFPFGKPLMGSNCYGPDEGGLRWVGGRIFRVFRGFRGDLTWCNRCAKNFV